MNPRAVNRLHDALDSARTAQHFITGHTLNTFIRSRLVGSAVERELAIIGEAINIEGIPTLREWVGLRNILIHAYNDILPEVVWETVVSELPDLIVAFESLLAAHGNEAER